MKAIPTTYRGVNFRSRLEAKWAAMFDELGWAWEYEPFDAHGYIPDFVLLGECPVLVEVKPAASLLECQQHENKVDVALGNTWTHDVLIIGCTPILPELSSIDEPIIGAHGEY